MTDQVTELNLPRTDFLRLEKPARFLKPLSLGEGTGMRGQQGVMEELSALQYSVPQTFLTFWQVKRV
jgi:hypothetical protein